MELILQNNLEHQQKPVDAICNVFKGVKIEQDLDYKNCIVDLTDANLKNNIKSIQEQNKISISQIYSETDAKYIEKCLNLDIKMETGTGKTYVYTKSIYELHKRYGINKFIIVVPSLPIKAGTKQFIKDPAVLRHFQDTCGYGTTIDLQVLESKQSSKGKRYFPSEVRSFVSNTRNLTNKIYVLLVNMSLLTNGKLLSRNDYDSSVENFNRPFDALKATRSFVIIDEPHRFSNDQKAYETIIKELQPQCIIRFGATFPMTKYKTEKKKHIDYKNLLYDLNACDAFNQNLIKGIAKEHFEVSYKINEKIKLTDTKKNNYAKFIYHTSNSSKSYELKKNDSLGIINEGLSGLTINGIGKDFIELSNGQCKKKGEEFAVDIYTTSYQEGMLRLAIKRHFEIERQNFERNIKIKTLALFFIDDIDSFRGNKENKAWLRDKFDELLIAQINDELKKTNSDEYKEYLNASKDDIAGCRAGYFARDNSNKDDDIAKEVQDILHNKKELLSFKKENGKINIRRFLFSKWTLKEGWDNPNIFTIAKLRSSGSEISKIQEVGRGLRLPVDENGNRISNYEFKLNYIVDFSEADFANKLVEEVNAQIPNIDPQKISETELKRVASFRKLTPDDLFSDLIAKKYIDRHYIIKDEKRSAFYQEYPEFNNISNNKIIDINKNEKKTITIRPNIYNELKELWKILNKKYIIYFKDEINKELEKKLPNILDGVLKNKKITSKRETVKVDTNKKLTIVDEDKITYEIKGRKLLYNDFLKKINRATHIPIISIHNAICEYAKNNPDTFNETFINDATLEKILINFNKIKIELLSCKFCYKQTKYLPTNTALTKSDGTLRDDVAIGLIGTNIDKGNAQEKYLYNEKAYDSKLELENIKENIDEVIVFGKIPRKSISIPTIYDSYSPDFMYIIKKGNGKNELIIETKGYDDNDALSNIEKEKINSAKKFFEQLKQDGYNVYFKTQTNNQNVINIINSIIKD